MKGLFIRSVLAVLIFLAFLLIACGGGGNEKAKAFDRVKMFKDLSESIYIPKYEEFSTSCDELVDSYENFKKNKNQENFESLRHAWRKAQSAWEETECFGFGPATNNGYIYNLDFSPCRVSLIESSLASKDNFIESDMEGIGAAAKGLPVIEYFLYNPVLGNKFDQFLVTNKEQSFFDSLLKYTATNAKSLLNQWLSSGCNFVGLISSPGLTNLEYTTEQQVIDDMVNVLVVQIEVIRDKKIGKPLGKNADGAKPELSEAPYSKSSLESIKANLKGIKAYFTYVENRLILIDYLDAISAEHSQTILQQLEKFSEKLEKQTLSLEEIVVSEKTEAEELFDLFIALVKDVKYMVTAMGVTLHSSDNDGD
jgi:predicted lipoprotein